MSYLTEIQCDSKKILNGLLGKFFRDNFYVDGINELRQTLRNNDYYKNAWDGIIELVVKRDLNEGEALYIMNNCANLPLFENSDEETYKWLNLMIINASRNIDEVIIDYEEIFNEDDGQFGI